MYLSTAHDGLLALDADSGHLHWHRPYNPAYVILHAVNRGVGLGGGKAFIATEDSRLIALDAATGGTLWNAEGYRDIGKSFYSMAAYVCRDEVIIGIGGGDKGALGLVSVFSIRYEKRLWDWQTADPQGSMHITRGFASSANGVVLAGSSDGNFYALDARTGQIKWTFSSGGAVWSDAAIVDGTVYRGSGYDTRVRGTPYDGHNSRLYAFSLDGR